MSEYKTIKCVKDNTGENLDDLGFDNDIVENNSKAMIHERNNS